jgi:hypothetical protein
MRKTGKCSINPKHKYTHYGNNAEPVNSGRCCDECNDMVVIPVRIMGAQMSAMRSALGSLKSPAKAKASRANGKKGGRPPTA